MVQFASAVFFKAVAFQQHALVLAAQEVPVFTVVTFDGIFGPPVSPALYL